MYYILPCYSRTWSNLYQSRTKEVNSWKSTFFSCDTFSAQKLKERLLHFPLANWRIKRELIHNHSFLYSFTILTTYLESRLRWLLPSTVVECAELFSCHYEFGFTVFGKVFLLSTSLLSLMRSKLQRYKRFLWRKFQKQYAHTIWVKGTRVSVLKRYRPCMGEKLVLEKFTNGISFFEKKGGFQFSENDTDNGALYSEGMGGKGD